MRLADILDGVVGTLESAYAGQDDVLVAQSTRAALPTVPERLVLIPRVRWNDTGPVMDPGFSSFAYDIEVLWSVSLLSGPDAQAKANRAVLDLYDTGRAALQTGQIGVPGLLACRLQDRGELAIVADTSGRHAAITSVLHVEEDIT